MKCPKCHFENPSDIRFCGNCGAPLHPGDLIPFSPTETLQAPIVDLTTGTTFAKRYQVIEELGKGGMGKVYKVFDTKIKEKVALKLIKPETSSDREAIERFSNELRLARKIRHKNICQMFDLGEAEGTLYITMEYVSGEDLKKLIRMSGQLNIGTIISVAKQLCEGLAEAHRLGIIHRDLKPQNIMVDEEGNARIMDFGIARFLEAKGTTGTGVMIGTPEYMSPEQVEGKETDPRSDIYSLGVILFEMATGRVPFRGDTAISVALKQKTEAPPDPKEYNARVPLDLSRLILKCLEKDGQKRYQSAAELLYDLGNILSIPFTEEKILQKKKPETAEVAERERKNSIAVLPFPDLSPQKDQEYFCDGITEELINALTKIEGLKVASKTSSFQFKGKSLDIEEIGKRLKVQAVLEGSVRKAGNRIRITAQLINVEDGYHLWSEKYDRDMEDIFAIQDEISLAIVDKLKIKLLGEERAKLTKRYTENQEAYSLFLKGRYYWNRRFEGELNKAIEFFQQAIVKDPAYALAYSGIADCYNLIGLWGFLPPKEVYPKAKAATIKALEIDETLSEAQCSLGWISAFYDWNWQAAEREFRKAIELNPKYATAHSWYSLYLVVMGRFDEAIDEQNKALELDPLSLIINAMLGLIFMFAGEFDSAVNQLHGTIEMDSNFLYTYIFLGQTYSIMEWKGLGKYYAQAIKAFKKAIDLSGGMTYVLGHLGLTYSLAGKKDEAIKMLHQLEKLGKEKFVSPEQYFHIFMGLGEQDKAFGFLEKMYEERISLMAFYRVWHLADIFRSDPRFKGIMKKMGLG